MKARSISISEICGILNLDFPGTEAAIAGLWRDLDSQPVYTPVLTYCGNSGFLEKAAAKCFLGAIITIGKLAESAGPANREGVALIRSPDPEASFFELQQFLCEQSVFYQEFEFRKKIGSGCKIHASAVIEDGVSIGDNVLVEPGVVIKKGSRVGNNVRIKANTVIGADGFEVKRINGRLAVVRHAGGVKINDNVEIGSNCGIDKAMFEGFTEIGENVKIDNLTQIAHNCNIGKNTIICANSNISGAVNIGENCYLAPGVNIRNSLVLHDNTFIGMSALVTKDVPAGETWAGIPARLFKKK